MKYLQEKHTTLRIVFSLVFFISVTQSQMAVAWGWGDCEYSREIDKNVSLRELVELRVLAGAGSLKIVGDANQDEITINAKMCASNQQVLDQMNVAATHGSKALSVETIFPNKSMWGDDHNATIDLVLLVPSSLVLDVKDSSGEASVERVAELSMVDSSGRLEITHIAGDLKVVDSSGEMVIRNVGGDVNINDSSGAIIASKVAGNLVVEVDSSGAIDVRDVDKSVLVKVDSSGAINVQNIGGDFTVLKDSSGGITHTGVKGKVSI